MANVVNERAVGRYLDEQDVLHRIEHRYRQATGFAEQRKLEAAMARSAARLVQLGIALRRSPMGAIVRRQAALYRRLFNLVRVKPRYLPSRTITRSLVVRPRRRQGARHRRRASRASPSSSDGPSSEPPPRLDLPRGAA